MEKERSNVITAAASALTFLQQEHSEEADINATTPL